MKCFCGTCNEELGNCRCEVEEPDFDQAMKELGENLAEADTRKCLENG